MNVRLDAIEKGALVLCDRRHRGPDALGNHVVGRPCARCLEDSRVIVDEVMPVLLATRLAETLAPTPAERIAGAHVTESNPPNLGTLEA